MTQTLVGLTLAVLLTSLQPGHAGREGPQLWLAKRGEARVFILGFGEAKDMSWLTPTVDRAFRASSQLWLENAGPHAADSRDAAAHQAAAARMERLGRETGRTLFDALEPSVRTRTIAYLSELGIREDSVRGLRPWKAYYSIVRAFWSQNSFPYQQVDVAHTLEERALGASMRIGYEMPTSEIFVNFMAAMSDRAQSQYVEWLLDFLDDYKRGLNDERESFAWISGTPGAAATRSLDRMRTRMPELYQVMQPRRNAWWARKINELLDQKGTSFIAIGQLHTLGPDGIPRQLQQRGIILEPVP